MRTLLKNGSAAGFGVGLVMAGLVVGGMLLGAAVALRYCGASRAGVQEGDWAMAEQLLHASSASTGKQMAMATGQVYEEAEGLFVLDFLTGDLYCWVLNPRNLMAGYIGVFKTNVIKDLGIEKGKNPDYILATGNVAPIRRGTSAQPANCVVYVADGSTGNVAAYSLAYSRTMANAGRPQTGPLIRVALARARPAIQREQ